MEYHDEGRCSDISEEIECSQDNIKPRRTTKKEEMKKRRFSPLVGFKSSPKENNIIRVPANDKVSSLIGAQALITHSQLEGNYHQLFSSMESMLRTKIQHQPISFNSDQKNNDPIVDNTSGKWFVSLERTDHLGSSEFSKELNGEKTQLGQKMPEYQASPIRNGSHQTNGVCNTDELLQTINENLDRLGQQNEKISNRIERLQEYVNQRIERNEKYVKEKFEQIGIVADSLAKSLVDEKRFREQQAIRTEHVDGVYRGFVMPKLPISKAISLVILNNALKDPQYLQEFVSRTSRIVTLYDFNRRKSVKAVLSKLFTLNLLDKYFWSEASSERGAPEFSSLLGVLRVMSHLLDNHMSYREMRYEIKKIFMRMQR